jgi:hypothetical protein
LSFGCIPGTVYFRLVSSHKNVNVNVLVGRGFLGLCLAGFGLCSRFVVAETETETLSCRESDIPAFVAWNVRGLSCRDCSPRMGPVCSTVWKMMGGVDFKYGTTSYKDPPIIAPEHPTCSFHSWLLGQLKQCHSFCSTGCHLHLLARGWSRSLRQSTRSTRRTEYNNQQQPPTADSEYIQQRRKQSFYWWLAQFIIIVASVIHTGIYTPSEE